MTVLIGLSPSASYILQLLSPQLQLVVRVEVEGGRVWEVTVREGAPVINVMFRVAKAAGIELDITSALFEISEHLRIRKTEHTPPLQVYIQHSYSIPHFYFDSYQSLFHSTFLYSYQYMNPYSIPLLHTPLSPLHPSFPLRPAAGGA